MVASSSPSSSSSSPPGFFPDHVLARLERVEQLYAEGKIAQSMRQLTLAGWSVREADVVLTQAGFLARVEPLFAGRDLDGAPLWRVRDGRTSSDRIRTDFVRVHVYVHPDGGLVRIFPDGDPSGMLAPAGRASARKAVLFAPPPPPSATERRLDDGGTSPMRVHTDPSNEAFRVSDDGEPLAGLRLGVRTTRGATNDDERATIALRGEVR